MNYVRSLIITCEFMAAKVLLILLCTTTIFVELCIADSQEPWTGKEISAEVKFLSEPEDVIVAPGQSAKFFCDVSVSGGDTKSISYIWKHNGVYKKPKATGTLTVNTGPAKKEKKDKEKDGGEKEKEGLYHCIANTTFGLLKSRAARLKLADISSASKENLVSDITASEGENVRLSCEINSVPEAQITWYFDDAPISNRTEKYLISSKYLYINNTQKPDAGEYRCLGSNPLTRGQANLSFTLTVDESLNLSKKNLEFISPEIPKNLTVERGRNLSLHCHVNKANALVKWVMIKNDPRGQVSSRPSLLQNSFFTLEFGQVNENSYEYVCIAEIYADSSKRLTLEQIQQTVAITVGEAPKILGISSSRLMENLGIPKRFSCNVSGYPPPTVKWFHNGEELDPNKKSHRFTITWNFEPDEKVYSHSLAVLELEYRDRGVYQCVAENEFGSASSATVLTIDANDGIPPQVTNVKCRTINTTDIMITFNYTDSHPHAPKVDVAEEEVSLINTGDGGSSATRITGQISDIFVVSYYREDDMSDHNTASATNRTIIIGNLRPDSTYWFSVKRFNAKLASDPSDRIPCSTSGSTKRSLAPIAYYYRLFSNSVLVYWHKLHDERSFEIEVQNIKNSSNTFRLLSFVNYTVVSNLTVGDDYKISVYSLPSRDAYEPVKITMEPLDTKFRFQVYKINESSAVLIWKLSDIDIVKEFQVKYTKHGHEGDGEGAYIEDGTSFSLIHGLTPGETYDASLWIMLDDGVNDYATELSKLTFTMPLTSPKPVLQPIDPGLIDCYLVNSEIRFLWFYAEPTTCVFLVKYRPLNSTDYKLKPTLEKNVRFYNVPQNFGYEFSIQAVNENGDVSNFTTPRKCKTKAGIPGKVYNISYTQVSSRTVYLSWNKPENFDPSTYLYVVSYGIRNQTKPERKMDISAFNVTKIRVSGDTNSIDIPGLAASTEYVIVVRVENIQTHEGFDSPKRIIVLQPRPEEKDETFIGLVIGSTIGVAFILVCTISAIFGKKLLKQYYYERNNSLRSLSAYKKPDTKILAKNSIVLKNSAAYGNCTNLQSPLLSNGTFVNGGVQITDIEGVRYCPGAGKRGIRLLNGDSPLDDTYEKIMEAADTDRDREGGDSGYCDKPHSQSPPLKDSDSRRYRKSSDIPTDDGFHELNEIYINGSSPV